MPRDATSSFQRHDTTLTKLAEVRQNAEFRMPDDEHDPQAVYGIVHDEPRLDGNSWQNLATSKFD